MGISSLTTLVLSVWLRPQAHQSIEHIFREVPPVGRVLMQTHIEL